MMSHSVKQLFNNEYDGEALLHELHRQMFIVAYAKTRNKVDALDVVQDAWVKILINIDTLRDETKLFPWAKTIVSHTAINALKSNGKEVLIDRAKIDDVFPAYDERFDDHVIVNDIKLTMQMFDAKTACIMMYKFHYDYQDQHIADKLQMPLGTVKAKIHRQLKRLRAYYETD